MSDEENKSRLRVRYEQFMYWSSIVWDVIRPGESGSVYVLGYVKSGTNWLCHLLSGALDVPILESWKYRFLRFGPSVYHMHRIIPFDSVRRRTVYMMRDGRDTVVSHYFQLLRQGGVDKKEFERYLGREIGKEDMRENLPDFIRYVQTSRVATVDYRTHLEAWFRNRDRYITVRYEDLLADTAGELSRVVAALTGQPADMDRINAVVKIHDFTRMTGRTMGVEDSSAFVRKGVVGDWKNYFSAEAARVYDDYAGKLLLELGYEDAPDWADKIV